MSEATIDRAHDDARSSVEQGTGILAAMFFSIVIAMYSAIGYVAYVLLF